MSVNKKYKGDFQRLNRRNMWVRNEKRKELVSKYANKRRELKEQCNWEALDKLPRNSSKVRLRNLCQLTGRSTGYIRKFKLCRFKFRELAINGELPGIKKASW